MQVVINGAKSEIPDNTSIWNLVKDRKLPAAIVIDLNGAIINREEWENTRLNPDDSLEIIRIIGGG